MSGGVQAAKMWQDRYITSDDNISGTYLSESEAGDARVASPDAGAAHHISCLQDLPLGGLLEGLVLALVLAAQLTLLIFQLLQLAQVSPVWHVHMPHLEYKPMLFVLFCSLC